MYVNTLDVVCMSLCDGIKTMKNDYKEPYATQMDHKGNPLLIDIGDGIRWCIYTTFPDQF